MDVQEMLQQFATNTGTFPREAVAQAIAQREATTPELLRVLAEAQHTIEDLSESDSMAHIYAMYLLAQFREPRAYPRIVEFFSIPGDIALDTTGDVATEDLGRILLDICMQFLLSWPQGHADMVVDQPMRGQTYGSVHQYRVRVRRH